jgi:hypothetical protein
MQPTIENHEEQKVRFEILRSIYAKNFNVSTSFDHLSNLSVDMSTPEGKVLFTKIMYFYPILVD